MNKPISRNKGWQWGSQYLLKYATIILFALIILTFSILSSKFFSLNNLINILVQASALGIIATGMTFVLLTAGIDLSVGSIMFLAGVISAKMVVNGHPLWLATVCILIIGLIFGCINAFFIYRLKIIPFIVTLSTFYIGRGLGLYISDTRAINLPEHFLQIGSAKVLGIPLPIVLFILVIAIAQLVLSYTSFGKQIYAVGNSMEKAHKAGLTVNRILFSVYVICGFCAALGGFVAIAQLGAVSPTFGYQSEFVAIAAAVLGGASLFGGKGTVFPGTLVGALFIQALQSGLVIVNADPYLYPLIMGAVIFLIVLIDSLKHLHEIRMRKLGKVHFLMCLSILFVFTSCQQNQKDRLTIGISFETLQTEYWVTSIEAIKAECKKRGIGHLEAVANGDANRQFEQVHNFIARGVDGIVIAPKDGHTIIPIIKAANRANIPIVIYNRLPAKNKGKYTTVVADNFEITKNTVEYMCEMAKASGKPQKAMILIGDLGDINAVNRRKGFMAAIAQYPEIELVAEVPTEWNQEKALAGVTNALQANPDINFIFTSSDFLFPSIISALKNADKYYPVGHEKHVLLGGFDGDAMAYDMLVNQYLDADGVQDVFFECASSVEVIVKQLNGAQMNEVLVDPGFVIHQENIQEKQSQMWGATINQ